MSPVGGSAPPAVRRDDTTPFAAEDFPRDLCGDERPAKRDREADASHAAPTVCPAGHRSVEDVECADRPGRVVATFAKATCEACADHERCPVRANAVGTGYTVEIDLGKANLRRRRLVEASGEFRPRYAVRALPAASCWGSLGRFVCRSGLVGLSGAPGRQVGGGARLQSVRF